MKRIILLLTIITAFSTATCYNALDQNTTLEIPVANISVVDSAFTDWANVPVAITDNSSGAPFNDFHFVKIATNSSKSILYIYLNMYNTADVTNPIIINISNDGACNGYMISSGQVSDDFYPICGGASIASGAFSFLSGSEYEIQMDLATYGIVLKDRFLISASTSPMTDYTSSRWIKFR